ncbi:MAG: hypothetical protein Ct9H300mP14_04590 [Gammaproteobacteria bacterium]|nr:MAG: hypothetical protein Ct9H300mP14_04590 [Gammaproteobacteria bacterium]
MVDHTHADAILALTNQPQGEQHVRAALGDDIIVLPYIRPGFQLAKQVASEIAAAPQGQAMVWGASRYHRLWRVSTRELRTHDRSRFSRRGLPEKSATLSLPVYERLPWRWPASACLQLRLLYVGDWHARAVTRTAPTEEWYSPPLLTPDILAFLDTEGARNLALSPPLTSDHLYSDEDSTRMGGRTSL